MVRFAVFISAAVLGLSATSAFAQAAEAAKPAEPVIGPHPNPALPIGGYLKAPAGSIRLIEKEWKDATGLPLYVLARECFGQCAVMFPPLTPAKDAKPTKDWTNRVRAENGDRQWVYKGKPIYTFVDDKADIHPQADKVLAEVSLARP